MKTILGFPDYSITKDGRVWSKTRKLSNGRHWQGQWVKSFCKKGYLQIGLRKRGGRIWRSIHRLVLNTYIGFCPKGMEACHNNGNRKDNRLKNLRWDTKSNNIKDAIRHGTHRNTQQTGEKNKMAKLTDEKVKVILCLYRVAKFSLTDIAWQFDVHYRTIWDICRGVTWKHLYAQI